MPPKPRILQNFLALGSGEAISRLINFAATIYLARLFGASGYGVIAFALAVNLYLTKIGEYAFEWVGTAEIARTHGTNTSLASSLLSARLVLALIVITISAMITWFVLPDPERSILLLYLLVLVPTALNPKWIHIGMEDAKPVGLSRVAGETLALVIIISLVKSKNDLWVAPIAQLCGEMCITLLLIWALGRRSYKFSLHWDLASALPIFRKATPLVLHMLLGLFIYNSDLIFLRLFHNSESVGIYSIAYVLISFIANLGIAYGMSLMPVFANMKGTNEEGVSFYHTILAQIFAFTAPLTLGGFFFAPNVIELAFGTGYSGSILVLQLIIWSIPFNIFRNAPWVALIAKNRQDLLFKAILYAAIANMILNILLIPSYGIIGAAISTIITEILVSLLMLFFASKHGLSFLPLRRLLRPLMATVVMYISLVLINPSNLFLGVGIGIVIYVSTLSLIGGIQYRKGSLPKLNI